MDFGRKKSNNNAKKAMKLHHKEGITLKQAWKIVKCTDNKTKTCKKLKKKKTKSSFGNPTPPKLVGYEFIKGKYVKMCKNGGRGRYKNGRCKLPLKNAPDDDHEINEKTGRVRKKCKPPSFRIPSGRCITEKSVIPPGKKINPLTGRLVNICPDGKRKDGKCKKPRTLKDPPPGFYRDPFTRRFRKISIIVIPRSKPDSQYRRRSKKN